MFNFFFLLKWKLFYTLFTQNALLLYLLFLDFGINTGRTTISVIINKSQNNQMSDNVDAHHILHTVSVIEKPI